MQPMASHRFKDDEALVRPMASHGFKDDEALSVSEVVMALTELEQHISNVLVSLSEVAGPAPSWHSTSPT